eukprot:9481265-Pyramimonas_sp.AAC.2
MVQRGSHAGCASLAPHVHGAALPRVAQVRLSSDSRVVQEWIRCASGPWHAMSAQPRRGAGLVRARFKRGSRVIMARFK